MGVISLSFVCFQAEYQNYSELKEPIVQEIEESTSKGVLVRSARRFVEGLASSRATYARKLQLLMEQVRLAREQRDYPWLRNVAECANKEGFKSHQWICENIAVIGPRRQRPPNKKARQINETFGIAPVRDIRLGLDSTIQRRVSDAQDSPQDILPQDSPQDILPQDNLPQDNSPHDILLQDISPQDNLPQDISPLITQEEEERLLASSHDSSADSAVLSIYAPIEFESDSVVPCHALMEPEVPEKEIPPSHMDTPTDQEKTRRFEEQGARPKSFRRQQEERWQLLSGEQMKFRIPIQDVPTRESRRSDRHSSTRRPSGSHHRRSSTSRERPSTKSSSTSHQRSSTPRRQSSRSYSSPSRQSRGSYSDLKDRHSGKDTRRISDRPSASKSSTATSRYRSDRSDSKRVCSSVREEGKRSRYSASSNLSDRSEVHHNIPSLLSIRLSDRSSKRTVTVPSPSKQPQYTASGSTHRRQYPEAFDASCHYYQLLEDLRLPWNVHPMRAFSHYRCSPVMPGFEVNLSGAVLVFSDPARFPSRNEVIRLTELGFAIVVGVKPRIRILDQHLEDLVELLQMSQVAALGELGLDHSTPCDEWVDQSVDITRQLDTKPLGLEPSKITVVKCRGIFEQDPSEAIEALYNKLFNRVGGNQLVHFTCFTGSHRMVEMWLQGFPQTYFGFCNRFDSFDESQCDAVRRLDESRILLETYSPYLKFGGHKPSTPNQLGMVAERVARIRGCSWQSVLASATRNAKRLYLQKREPDCELSANHRHCFR